MCTNLVSLEGSTIGFFSLSFWIRSSYRLSQYESRAECPSPTTPSQLFRCLFLHLYCSHASKPASVTLRNCLSRSLDPLWNLFNSPPSIIIWSLCLVVTLLLGCVRQNLFWFSILGTESIFGWGFRLERNCSPSLRKLSVSAANQRRLIKLNLELGAAVQTVVNIHGYSFLLPSYGFCSLELLSGSSLINPSSDIGETYSEIYSLVLISTYLPRVLHHSTIDVSHSMKRNLFVWGALFNLNSFNNPYRVPPVCYHFCARPRSHHRYSEKPTSTCQCKSCHFQDFHHHASHAVESRQLWKGPSPHEETAWYKSPSTTLKPRTSTSMTACQIS